MTDDRTLLLRTRRGDEASARELWARLAPRLLAYARGLVGQTGDDAVQEAFCTILRRPVRELRRVEDPPAWIARLVRNAALNAARTDARERARRARHAPVQPAPTLVDDDTRRAMDELHADARELLLLKHAAGLTFDQMALALGLNRSTAADRYRAARDELARRLEPSPEPTT